MRTHSLFAAAVATGALLQSFTADAIVISRITRRGYIVSSDTELWGSTIPVDSTANTVQFISAVTSALSEVGGFHEGQYLAAMQIPTSTSALAFYLPIRNDVRGIGQRSPLDNRSEVFDLNGIFGSSFQLDGFVFLNTYRFYTDPRAVDFGRYLICTQEFGHRFGSTFRANTAAQADAGVADGGTALAADSYLGRGNQLPSGMVVNRSHWSYFFNSGGSPMEGNAWTETSPGTFRTSMPSFRFSPFDLYAMGLIPSSEVDATFLIADATNVPNGITRDSPPEYNGRTVTVRGRRVNVGLSDLVRANGARNPAYDEEASHDLDVVWVLLANPSQVTDQLARDFDTAVDSCAQGYSFATRDRGHLVTTVPDVGQFADAAADASADDAASDAAVDDAALDDASASDAASDGARPVTPGAPGEGCNCTAAPSPRASASPALFALCLAAFGVRRARRRTAR